MTNQAPRNPIIKPINGLEIANQSGIASRSGSESRLRICQCLLAVGFVELPGASSGINWLRERMAFMASSLDDDSIPANARVWDFVMPPESCWTIPLSSECVSAQAVVPGLAICCTNPLSSDIFSGEFAKSAVIAHRYSSL